MLFEDTCRVLAVLFPPVRCAPVSLRCVFMAKVVRLYWGYMVAAALVVAWSQQWALPVIVALSVGVSAYAGFQVPVWCGAVNRDGRTYCRNNAYGVLMGCSKRQHRWQKIKMIVLRSKVGNVSRSVFPTAKEKFNGALAVGGLLSAVAAVIVPVVTGG
ncbi:hypothetical protein [Streptomyces sp. M1013]|nr:hypothetical protein [Streptomyces sp. M1013]